MAAASANGMGKAVEKPFGPFERMLAMRYLRAKREHGGLALISLVSVFGITLSVMALIIIMSVMNGFRDELISKILGFAPHVVVDTQGLPKTQADARIEEIQKLPGVTGVEPMLEGQVFLSGPYASAGALVRGIRPNDLRANKLIANGIQSGSLDQFGADSENSDHVVIGQSLASELGAYVGARIKVTQSNGPETPMGRSVSTRTLIVVATFHVGNEIYDRGTIFMPLDASTNFFRYDDGYPAIGIRLAKPDDATAFKNQITPRNFGPMTTWIERSGNYFTALQVERHVMALIMLIVVLITTTNIITGVLMLVKNKARDIAILRTVGATRSGVMRIFLMTGSMLGGVGVAVGVTLGVLFCVYIAPIQHFLEWVFHVQLFPPDVYNLDHLPTRLDPAEVTVVAIISFLMSAGATLMPSLWATKLDPVEALRFQ